MWTRLGISFLAPIHHHPPVTRVVSFGLFLSLKQLIRFPKRKATWTVKKQDCCRPPLFFSRGGSWIGHSAFLLGHTADEIEVAPITQKSTTCQREMKELLMTFRLPCCDVLESSSSSSVSSGGEDEGGFTSKLNNNKETNKKQTWQRQRRTREIKKMEFDSLKQPTNPPWWEHQYRLKKSFNPLPIGVLFSMPSRTHTNGHSVKLYG